MTVRDLKLLLLKPEGVTMKQWNDTKVLIPMGEEFDGYFQSPCCEESGAADFGIDEQGDETDLSFILVPCGFFEHEDENFISPELN